jgi:hypothetical protein
MPTKPRLPSGASEASRAGIPPSSPSPATTGSSGVGRPGHKERRGKVKRPFFYLEEDFLRARTFAAWDDLRSQVRQWLDTVANVRVHGTTRRRVDEAYAEERPCLIALPPVDYPAERRETRTVQKDGLVPIDGIYYPAPVSRPVQEARFLARFPDAVGFLDGLKQRMTLLTPIHLRALERLATLYGETPQRAHPTVIPEPAVPPLDPRPEALAALDDVDPGSPRDYTLDSMAPHRRDP